MSTLIHEVEVTMPIKESVKNAATAAAIIALQKKYNRVPKAPDKGDEEKETAALCDKLNAAKLSLTAGIDRLIARANKGGSSNGELIKITDQVNSLAKKMG